MSCLWRIKRKTLEWESHSLYYGKINLENQQTFSKKTYNIFVDNLFVQNSIRIHCPFGKHAWKKIQLRLPWAWKQPESLWHLSQKQGRSGTLVYAPWYRKYFPEVNTKPSRKPERRPILLPPVPGYYTGIPLLWERNFKKIKSGFTEKRNWG